MDIGKREGAQVITGGAAAQLNSGLEKGYIQPTILKGNNKMRVFREEIFPGPVVCVTTLQDNQKGPSLLATHCMV